MADEDDTWGSQTGSALFQSGAWASLTGDRPAPPTEPIYEDRGLLGVGAMARVRLAFDPVLKREVAIKEPLDADAALRLAREAVITALMEHPGVPPVYALGRSAQGLPWFAMRRIDGQSLRAVLDDPARPGLAALVRRLHAVCEVVAQAHSLGVVHRDLKPENLMVAGFGATFVLDWGVAATLDEPAEQAGSAGPVGTYGYMSPEAQAGAPPDPRMDVWSLGALLYEVMAGTPPWGERGPIEAATHLAQGDPITPPEGPPPLAAIAMQALAFDPLARYPHADAMAADLAAWLEGRAVAAYTPSPVHLLRQTVRVWRRPLLGVVGAAALGVGLATTVVRRIVDERERAVAAESQQAQTAFRLRLARAADAEEAGRRAQAEALAARALTDAPSAEARGVLARWGSQPRPVHRGAVDLPCPNASVALGAAGAVCADGDALLGLDPATGAVRWRRPASRAWALAARAPVWVRFRRAGAQVFRATDGQPMGEVTWHSPSPQGVSVDPDGRWALLGGRAPHRVRLSAPPAVSPWRPCPTFARLTGTAGDTHFAVCADGALVAGTAEAPERRLSLPLAPGQDPAHLLWPLDPHRALIAADVRTLFLADLQAGEARPIARLPDRIARMVAAGDRVALLTRRGEVHLLSLPDGATLARLPAVRGGGLHLDRDTLWVGGQPLQLWDVTDATVAVRLRAPAGVMPAQFSPDGRWIAAAGVDGAVHVWRGDGRAPRALSWPAPHGPVKWLSFSPSGDTLTVAAMGDAPHQRFEVGTWRPLGPAPFDATPARRVVDLGEVLLLARFKGGLQARRLDGDPVPSMERPGPHDDVDQPAGRAVALVLARSGQVWRASADGLTEWGAVPGAKRVALAPDARTWAWSDGRTVELRGADRQVRWTRTETARVTDLALSAKHLAIAFANGRVAVHAHSGKRLAWLNAHGDVVGSVAFDASGERLLTSGWDREVHVWGMGSLSAAPGKLLNRLGQAGGAETR